MRVHSNGLCDDRCRCQIHLAIRHRNCRNRRVLLQPIVPVYDCSLPTDDLIRGSLRLAADKQTSVVALECPAGLSFCLSSSSISNFVDVEALRIAVAT